MENPHAIVDLKHLNNSVDFPESAQVPGKRGPADRIASVGWRLSVGIGMRKIKERTNKQALLTVGHLLQIF